MNPRPLDPVLKSIFSDLTGGPKQKNARLIERWAKIVGEKISKQATPKFRKDGSVVVWTESASLAYELSQKYGAAILKRLQNEFGENEVGKIRFCVGTSKFER